MIAAHLGVVDEDQINNMSYIFFEDVLTELGYKLNFEAIANYAGNSFMEKSWDMIQDSNPLNIGDGNSKTKRSSQQALAGFLSTARVATPEDLSKYKAIKESAVNNEKA